VQAIRVQVYILGARRMHLQNGVGVIPKEVFDPGHFRPGRAPVRKANACVLPSGFGSGVGDDLKRDALARIGRPDEKGAEGVAA